MSYLVAGKEINLKEFTGEVDTNQELISDNAENNIQLSENLKNILLALAKNANDKDGIILKVVGKKTPLIGNLLGGVDTPAKIQITDNAGNDLIPNLQDLDQEVEPANLEEYITYGKLYNCPEILIYAFNIAHKQENIAIMKDALQNISSEGLDLNQANSNNKTPLELAIANNNDELVKLLLDKGADANQANSNNKTPLELAIANNNDELVKLLVDKGADVNKANSDNKTPLMMAIEAADRLNDASKKPAALKVITKIAATADFRPTDTGKNSLDYYNKGKNALHKAAETDDTEIMQALLENNTNSSIKKSQSGAGVPTIDKRNKQGKKPLDIALEKGNFKIAEQLTNAGADLSKAAKPMYIDRALDSKELSFAADLRKAAADSSKINNIFNEAFNTKSFDIITRMCKEGVDVNIANSDNKTPLMIAIEVANGLNDGDEKNGALNAIKAIATTADFKATDTGKNGLFYNKGENAIHKAAKTNDTKIMQALLENNINSSIKKSQSGAGVPTIDKRNLDGKTPLEIAITNNNGELVKLLINAGADVNKLNKENKTPLMMAIEAAKGLNDAAKKTGALEAIKAIAAKANFKATNDEGKNAIHLAIETGNIAIVQNVLEEKSQYISKAIDIRDNSGKTPLAIALDLAVNEDSENILSEVAKLSNLATTDNSSNNGIHLAVMTGNNNLLESVLSNNQEKKSENAENKNNTQTKGNKSKNETINEQKYPELNQLNNDGYSPLHLAVRAGNSAMISTLLASGADINLKTKNQEDSAIHLLFNNPDLTPDTKDKVLGDLVQKGFDINAKNKQGENILFSDILGNGGNLDNITTLIKNGVRVDDVNKHGKSCLTLFIELFSRPKDKTALTNLISSPKSSIHQVNALLAANADINNVYTHNALPQIAEPDFNLIDYTKLTDDKQKPKTLEKLGSCIEKKIKNNENQDAADKIFNKTFPLDRAESIDQETLDEFLLKLKSIGITNEEYTSISNHLQILISPSQEDAKALEIRHAIHYIQDIGRPEIESKLELKFRSETNSNYENTVFKLGKKTKEKGIKKILEQDYASEAPTDKDGKTIKIQSARQFHKALARSKHVIKDYQNKNILVVAENKGKKLKIYTDTHIIKFDSGEFKLKKYGDKSYETLHNPDKYLSHLVGTEDHPHHTSDLYESKKETITLSDEVKIVSYSALESDHETQVTLASGETMSISKYVGKYYSDIGFGHLSSNKKAEIIYDHQQRMQKKYKTIDSIHTQNLDHVFPENNAEIVDTAARDNMAQIAFENSFHLNLDIESNIKGGYDSTRSYDVSNAKPNIKKFLQNIKTQIDGKPEEEISKMIGGDSSFGKDWEKVEEIFDVLEIPDSEGIFGMLIEYSARVKLAVESLETADPKILKEFAIKYNINEDVDPRDNYQQQKPDPRKNYLANNIDYRKTRDLLKVRHEEATNRARNIMSVYPGEALELTEFLNERPNKSKDIPMWMSKDVTELRSDGRVKINFKKYELDQDEKKDLKKNPDDLYLKGKQERFNALKKLNNKNITKPKYRADMEKYLGSQYAACYNSNIMDKLEKPYETSREDPQEALKSYLTTMANDKSIINKSTDEIYEQDGNGQLKHPGTVEKLEDLENILTELGLPAESINSFSLSKPPTLTDRLNEAQRKLQDEESKYKEIGQKFILNKRNEMFGHKGLGKDRPMSLREKDEFFITGKNPRNSGKDSSTNPYVHQSLENIKNGNNVNKNLEKVVMERLQISEPDFKNITSNIMNIGLKRNTFKTHEIRVSYENGTTTSDKKNIGNETELDWLRFIMPAAQLANCVLNDGQNIPKWLANEWETRIDFAQSTYDNKTQKLTLILRNEPKHPITLDIKNVGEIKKVFGEDMIYKTMDVNSQQYKGSFYASLSKEEPHQKYIYITDPHGDKRSIQEINFNDYTGDPNYLRNMSFSFSDFKAAHTNFTNDIPSIEKRFDSYLRAAARSCEPPIDLRVNFTEFYEGLNLELDDITIKVDGKEFTFTGERNHDKAKAAFEELKAKFEEINKQSNLDETTKIEEFSYILNYVKDIDVKVSGGNKTLREVLKAQCEHKYPISLANKIKIASISRNKALTQECSKMSKLNRNILENGLDKVIAKMNKDISLDDMKTTIFEKGLKVNNYLEGDLDTILYSKKAVTNAAEEMALICRIINAGVGDINIDSYIAKPFKANLQTYLEVPGTSINVAEEDYDKYHSLAKYIQNSGISTYDVAEKQARFTSSEESISASYLYLEHMLQDLKKPGADYEKICQHIETFADVVDNPNIKNLAEAIRSENNIDYEEVMSALKDGKSANFNKACIDIRDSKFNEFTEAMDAQIDRQFIRQGTLLTFSRRKPDTYTNYYEERKDSCEKITSDIAAHYDKFVTSLSLSAADLAKAQIEITNPDGDTEKTNLIDYLKKHKFSMDDAKVTIVKATIEQQALQLVEAQIAKSIENGDTATPKKQINALKDLNLETKFATTLTNLERIALVGTENNLSAKSQEKLKEIESKLSNNSDSDNDNNFLETELGQIVEIEHKLLCDELNKNENVNLEYISDKFSLNRDLTDNIYTNPSDENASFQKVMHAVADLTQDIADPVLDGQLIYNQRKVLNEPSSPDVKSNFITGVRTSVQFLLQRCEDQNEDIHTRIETLEMAIEIASYENADLGVKNDNNFCKALISLKDNLKRFCGDNYQSKTYKGLDIVFRAETKQLIDVLADNKNNPEKNMGNRALNTFQSNLSKRHDDIVNRPIEAKFKRLNQSFKAINKNLKKQIKEVNDKCSKLQQTCNKLTETSNNQHQEVKQLRDDFNTKTKELRDDISENTKRLTNLLNLHKNIIKKIDANNSSIDEIKKSLQQIDHNIELQEESIADLNHSFGVQIDNVYELRNAIESHVTLSREQLTALANVTKNNIDNLEDQLNKSNGELEQKIATAEENITKKIDSLKEKFKDYTVKKSEQNEELKTQLEHFASHVEDSLSNLSDKGTEIANAIANIELDIKDGKVVLTKLRSEVSQLKSRAFVTKENYEFQKDMETIITKLEEIFSESYQQTTTDNAGNEAMRKALVEMLTLANFGLNLNQTNMKQGVNLSMIGPALDNTNNNDVSKLYQILADVKNIPKTERPAEKIKNTVGQFFLQLSNQAERVNLLTNAIRGKISTSTDILVNTWLKMSNYNLRNDELLQKIEQFIRNDSQQAISGQELVDPKSIFLNMCQKIIKDPSFDDEDILAIINTAHDIYTGNGNCIDNIGRLEQISLLEQSFTVREQALNTASATVPVKNSAASAAFNAVINGGPAPSDNANSTDSTTDNSTENSNSIAGIVGFTDAASSSIMAPRDNTRYSYVDTQDILGHGKTEKINDINKLVEKANEKGLVAINPETKIDLSGFREQQEQKSSKGKYDYQTLKNIETRLRLDYVITAVARLHKIYGINEDGFKQAIKTQFNLEIDELLSEAKETHYTLHACIAGKLLTAEDTSATEILDKIDELELADFKQKLGGINSGWFVKDSKNNLTTYQVNQVEIWEKLRVESALSDTPLSEESLDLIKKIMIENPSNLINNAYSHTIGNDIGVGKMDVLDSLDEKFPKEGENQEQYKALSKIIEHQKIVEKINEDFPELKITDNNYILAEIRKSSAQEPPTEPDIINTIREEYTQAVNEITEGQTTKTGGPPLSNLDIESRVKEVVSNKMNECLQNYPGQDPNNHFDNFKHDAKNAVDAEFNPPTSPSKKL